MTAPARGDRITVTGPLGQRDTTGTGSTGYRVLVTDPASISIAVPPAPTPTPAPSATPTAEPPSARAVWHPDARADPDSAPSPTPTPAATPSPTPTPAATPTPAPTPSTTPAPTASPSPVPTPTPSPITIATARLAGSGGRVLVEGIVTAEAGTLGLPSQVAIQDATGAIVVRLPDGVVRPRRGNLMRVAGRLADPYGQLEVRPATADVTVRGTGTLPDPVPVSAATLGEGVEARLVVMEGTLASPITREAGGDLVLRLEDRAGVPFRARAGHASGIRQTLARPGARLRLVGVVGQRASRKGALDGYRTWLRDPADAVVLAMPNPSSSPTPAPSPPAAGGPGAVVVPIAVALRAREGDVRVEGVVTTPATLLDGTGRRVIVQDRTGAVEILAPVGATVPAPGARVRIDGELGTAYGAPRIRAATVTVLGTAPLPAPRDLRRAPGPADEGELVRVTGRVTDLRRLGDRWRAEVRTRDVVVVVAGLAGSGIPSASMPEGSAVVVVGVVRRPHPAATDRRFAVAPRGPADVRGDPRSPGGPGATPGSDALPGGAAAGGTAGPRASAGSEASSATPGAGAIDVDLAVLPAAGTLVRVGGLVVAIDGDRVLVDDGTATAAIRLAGEAAELVDLIETGDAVGAVGRVATGPEGLLVEVDHAADLVRLGDLGETLPLDVVPSEANDVTWGASAGEDASAEPAGLVSAAIGGSGPPSGLQSPTPGFGPGGGAVPLAAFAGMSLALAGAWVAIVAARRRRSRRALAQPDRGPPRLPLVGSPGPAPWRHGRPCSNGFGSGALTERE